MSNEITYRVVLKDNLGCFAADALASAAEGCWHGAVERFDEENDLVFIDVPADCAAHFENILDDDDNVVSYAARD